MQFLTKRPENHNIYTMYSDTYPHSQYVGVSPHYQKELLLHCSEKLVNMERGGGGSPILDPTEMIVITLGIEIAVLVTIRVSWKENGENGNF